MKKLILLVIALVIAPALFAEDFDFKTLDRIGANAKSTASITLDSAALGFAARFLGSDNDSDVAAIKSLIGNLKGIYIRSWTFAKPGLYSETDLAPLRAHLKQLAWANIVDVRDEDESSQIYFQPGPNNKLGGVVLVSTVPTKVTVVYINGTLDRSDIDKLSGSFGVPDIKDMMKEKQTGNKKDK